MQEPESYKYYVDGEGRTVLLIVSIEVRIIFKDSGALAAFVALGERALSDAAAREGVRKESS